MKPDEIQHICDIVRKRAGLVLGQDKLYLLESRLLPLARNRNCKDLSSFVQMLKLKRDDTLLDEITEAMTTNESSFFRDIKPYDQLRKIVLPQLCSRASARTLRIWSAACASGQEPYSIAMCLREEAALLEGWHTEILATDIASRVVEKARSGTYTQFEVQRGMPIRLLLRYFNQLNDNQWQIHEDVRRMVNFRLHNLLSEPTPLGQFDIIFCRNVLIYFDEATKAEVLKRISKVLKPHGVLYLGSTETMIGVTDMFKPLSGERGIYQHID